MTKTTKQLDYKKQFSKTAITGPPSEVSYGGQAGRFITL